MAAYSGSLNVATSGTQVSLASAAPAAPRRCRWLTVVAKATNTGIVSVGDSAVPTVGGGWLRAGDTLELRDIDLQDWFLNAEVSGEGVTMYGAPA